MAAFRTRVPLLHTSRILDGHRQDVVLDLKVKTDVLAKTIGYSTCTVQREDRPIVITPRRRE